MDNSPISDAQWMLYKIVQFETSHLTPVLWQQYFSYFSTADWLNIIDLLGLQTITTTSTFINS